MTSSEENRQAFFDCLREALASPEGIRATLSKPSNTTRWKRVSIEAFRDSRSARIIAFHFDDARVVERKNFPAEEAYRTIVEMLPADFHCAYLRTINEELQFEYSSRGTYRLKRKHISAPPLSMANHDREKNYLIPPQAPFLERLGISSAAGTVRREMHDKFRQVNKFIETIKGLLDEQRIPDRNRRGISVVDFGSGKNYLTFALHEYLAHHVPGSTLTGVERREDLVEQGQDIATSLGLHNLHFEVGTIADTTLKAVDLVVALHACDTATDDAIAQAVTAAAPLICVAPCCHKYVRRHFHASADLAAMLRHGIIEERFTEGLTDSLRVLALEAVGYRAKLFEFISLEHTAKNVMITATRTGNPNRQSLEALGSLRKKFSLPDFYLDTLLGLV